jgi:hypothetical protein
MQAIQTKYFGPTNNRGSRIKAFCAAGSITISYPYELSGQACHRAAADTLIKKLGWIESSYGELIGGQLKSGDYVFVFNNQSGKE